MNAVCKRAFMTLAAISLLAAAAGCRNPVATESLRISIRNTDRYEHPTVGGDEEGATISVQARHYSISEIRRDSSTKWVATYVYQPLPGYLGTDNVELDIFFGSDGATAGNVKKLRLHFVVHD